VVLDNEAYFFFLLKKGIESKYDKEATDLSEANRIGMNKKYSIWQRDLSKVTLLYEGERD